MNYLILWVGGYAIIFVVLAIGLALGAPSWTVGVGAFVILFPFAMWLAYREARSSVERVRASKDQEPDEASEQDSAEDSN